MLVTGLLDPPSEIVSPLSGRDEEKTISSYWRYGFAAFSSIEDLPLPPGMVTLPIG